MEIDTELEVADILAQEIRREIDKVAINEVAFFAALEAGWVPIYMELGDTAEARKWCKTNCKDKFIVTDTKSCFKDEEDASYFAMRFS